MLVSKNGLTLIRLVPIEFESCRQLPTHPPQPLQRSLASSVAVDLELACAGDAHLDLIALFQFQRLDNHGGQAHRETVSPLRNLHGASLDIHRTQYIKRSGRSTMHPTIRSEEHTSE